jgi:thiol-disulfide isomerase/thioredoxin
MMWAQPPVLHSISPGEKVPAITFTNMLNNKSNTVKLSAFKGKFILLDFWATWCSNCLKKFSLLDSMQQAHTANLQVLLVNTASTHDTREKINRLLGRLAAANGRPLTLPVVFNDTLAVKLFPHKYLPHYVWIDTAGNCMAITGTGDVTAYNIKTLLSGGRPAFTLKEDLDDFNRKKPLFINGNGGSGSTIIHRSTFSAYINGLPSGSLVDKDSAGKITHILVTNTSLLHLLQQAFRSGLSPNRIQYAAGVEEKFKAFGHDGSAAGPPAYTYELLLPPATENTAMLLMQQDLERYTGFTAKITGQPTACYVLTADTAVLAGCTAGTERPMNRLSEKENRFMQNKPLKTLAVYLDRKLSRPVVDESGVSFNISLSLPAVDIGDINALRKALLPYGIRLTEAVRTLPNFIIYQNLKTYE